jgi:hypothetical protein
MVRDIGGVPFVLREGGSLIAGEPVGDRCWQGPLGGPAGRGLLEGDQPADGEHPRGSGISQARAAPPLVERGQTEHGGDVGEVGLHSQREYKSTGCTSGEKSLDEVAGPQYPGHRPGQRVGPVPGVDPDHRVRDHQ